MRVAGAADDVELVLIDPGADPALAVAPRPSSASAAPKAAPKAAPRPDLRRRTNWGANERWRSTGPKYNRTIQQVHLHHTATANDYKRSEVRGILRSIYRYHTKTLRWSDIGYNFLVDRFGRIWEGRAGGPGKPVRGAHTLGFNSTSTGVAVIGNFEEKEPRDEVVSALVRLAAWKLDPYDRNPRGRVSVFSHGSDRYPYGEKVRLRVIDGHRDTNDTACPSAGSSPTLAKSAMVQSSAAISASMMAREPEPGLPTSTRLPRRWSKLRMPESLRATTVNGSACTANTARRSLNAPSFSNTFVPL